MKTLVLKAAIGLALIAFASIGAPHGTAMAVNPLCGSGASNLSCLTTTSWDVFDASCVGEPSECVTCRFNEGFKCYPPPGGTHYLDDPPSIATSSAVARMPVRVALLATVATLGCTDIPRGAGVGESPAAGASLQLEVLASPPVLGAPMYPVATERWVWVADAHGDPSLHALDAESGAVVLSTGRRGDGPREFGQGVGGLFARAADGVWAWDGVHRRLLYFDAPGSGASQPPLDLATDRLIGRLVIEGDRIIGDTNDLDARFMVFDLDGRVTGRSRAPFYGDSSIPTMYRVEATLSGAFPCAWPGRGFAEVNALVGQIQLFDREARRVRRVDVPHPSDPSFAGDDDALHFEWPASMQYMSCVVVHDRLLALYSGTDANADAATHGSELHVFSWEGAFLGRHRLSRPVRTIGYDPHRDRLLATSLVDASVLTAPLPDGLLRDG